MPILCFETCYHYRMFLHGRLTRFASWLASTGVEKAFFFPLAFWKVVVWNPCIYANFIISNEIERRSCGFSESGRNIHLHQNVACASSNFLNYFYRARPQYSLCDLLLQSPISFYSYFYDLFDLISFCVYPI